MSDAAHHTPTADFWRRKLVALVHASPGNCLDLAGREEEARRFLASAGMDDDAGLRELLEQVEMAERFAASADRFVLPNGMCETPSEGRFEVGFIHPLSSQSYVAPASLSDQTGDPLGVLRDAAKHIGAADPRTAFFLHWRRWMENAVGMERENAGSLAFLPADPRLPDHAIWNHMTTVSALAGCLEETDEGLVLQPALLLFQLGPVQDFIAQARSTRDLWSGSYLLSWLVAHAMKAVSDKVGPDALFFPSLRGNGIFDALHRKEIYQTASRQAEGNGKTFWQCFLEEKGGKSPRHEEREERVARWLLTPTLPNRFLALVPASQAEELGRLAEAAVRAELVSIGRAVWEWIEREAERAGCHGLTHWRARWDAQIAAFPQISWAVQPWLGRDECLARLKSLPANKEDDDTPFSRLQDMLDFGEEWLPREDRDERYYKSSTKTVLDSPGILWSAHYALVDAKLAARRNTRDFAAWNDPGTAPDGSPKDSLSGKEECIGDEKFWAHLAKGHGRTFRTEGHRYGAMNLIKRIWCRPELTPYLPERLGLQTGEFDHAVRFKTVQSVACRNLGDTCKRRDESGDPLPDNPYVAVLAMDGDEMGKWVSGQKTPQFIDQVSADVRKHLEPILRAKGKTGIRRLLTPAYHLQFSEALANFASWLAEPIVSAFDGQLIYAGGDDVLAMLPAVQAIPCAEALRALFRGEPPAEPSRFHFAVTQTGYVNESAEYPLIVPGPRADVSIGLAIGHCQAPLQMLVREAQTAEKTAKEAYGRGALAISLYKRSGETIRWGCKWDDGRDRVALRLMGRLTEWSRGEPPPLPGRFPYSLAALLGPYRLQGPMPHMHDVLMVEFEHVLRQQGSELGADKRDELAALATSWRDQTAGRLEDFANLFLVETFINRPRGED
jgi:CRISPR-associated protein Cmr2